MRKRVCVSVGIINRGFLGANASDVMGRECERVGRAKLELRGLEAMLVRCGGSLRATFRLLVAAIHSRKTAFRRA